jgi:hypothetical protein
MELKIFILLILVLSTNSQSIKQNITIKRSLNSFSKNIIHSYSSYVEISLKVFDENRLNFTVSNLFFKAGFFQEYNYFSSLTKFEINCNKLIYFNDLSTFDSFWETNTEKKYILLLDNLDIVKYIQSKYYVHKVKPSDNFSKNKYLAILYNNITSPLTFVTQELNYPIIEINNDVFEKIFNFSNHLENISIKYDNTNILMPFDYLNISSYKILILSTVVFFIMIFNNFYFYYKHLNFLNKLFSGIFFMKYVIVILSYLYFKENSLYNIIDDENYEMFSIVYLETSLTILNSVYRTIFFFTILIIAHGWNLYIFQFSSNHIKKFVIIYLVIYIVICLDQVVDLFSYRWIIV